VVGRISGGGCGRVGELTRFGGDEFLNGQGRDDWPNIFRTGRTSASLV
jgi:hypothetical protein